MTKVKISVSKNISQENKNLISDYWKIENLKFKYSNLDLSKIYNISIEEIVEIVKGNSVCKISFKNCRKCKKENSYEVNIKAEYTYITNRLSKVCKSCKPDHIIINKNNLKIDYFNYYTYQYALENKLWTELSPIELKILKKIVNYKDKFLIYKHVFNGDVENKELWNIVQHIEDLGLIWIERDANRRIISFEFDDILKNEIFDLC